MKYKRHCCGYCRKRNLNGLAAQRETDIDVRIIVASNENLQDAFQKENSGKICITA